MAERVTTVRLRAEIADLKRQMADAGLAVKGVGDEAEKASKRSNDALSKISVTAGLLGAALVAASATAVMAFANFDQSMSNVQAATHETAANMGALRDAALEAGKRTVFSATESAGAIEELAKAGVETKDILAGGLDGALDLAAAGGLDVAEAAGIASVALVQFKRPGSDAAHIADGSVQDLGMALKQGGQVAAATGLSIEETTAALSAFASAGLLGSDAGTSLKTMLQRLTPQSDEAAALMKKLGVEAYDASGNFVGLAAYAGKLQTGLKDLTPEARNAALATLFGSDAVRAANVLYSEGEKGIRDWTAAVNDQGYASETAAIRLDNLKGDFEQLSGSVETAMIGLGESANGPLRAAVQGATDLVNAFASAPDAVQGVTLALIGSGGLVLLGIAGLTKLAASFNEIKSALATMNMSMKTAALRGAAIGGALTVAGLVIADFAQRAADARGNIDAIKDTLDGLGKTTSETTKAMNEFLSSDSSSRGAGSLIDQAEKFNLTAKDLRGYILGNQDAIAKVTANTSAWADSQLQVRDAYEYTVGYDFLTPLKQYSSQLTVAQKEALAKADADREAGVAAQDSAAATLEQKSALSKLADDMASGQRSTENYTDALKDLIDAQMKAAGIVLDMRDAQRNVQEAIAAASKAVEDNGQTLDITTDKGRKNQAALDAIANSSWDLIDSMRENNATGGELQAQMAASRQAFLDAAGAMGMGADEANALADKLGLIPKNVSTEVVVDTANAENSINRLITLFDGRTITMNVKTGEFKVNGTTLRGYDTGGWTGDGSRREIAGVTHGQEFVVKAGPASQYRGALEAMNAGLPLRGVVTAAPGAGSTTAVGDTTTINAPVTVHTIDPEGVATAIMAKFERLAK